MGSVGTLIALVSTELLARVGRGSWGLGFRV